MDVQLIVILISLAWFLLWNILYAFAMDWYRDAGGLEIFGGAVVFVFAGSSGITIMAGIAEAVGLL